MELHKRAISEFVPMTDASNIASFTIVRSTIVNFRVLKRHMCCSEEGLATSISSSVLRSPHWVQWIVNEGTIFIPRPPTNGSHEALTRSSAERAIWNFELSQLVLPSNFDIRAGP